MNDLEMLSLVGKPILRQTLPDAEMAQSSKEDGVAVMMDKLLAK